MIEPLPYSPPPLIHDTYASEHNGSIRLLHPNNRVLAIFPLYALPGTAGPSDTDDPGVPDPGAGQGEIETEVTDKKEAGKGEVDKEEDMGEPEVSVLGLPLLMRLLNAGQILAWNRPGYLFPAASGPPGLYEPYAPLKGAEPIHSTGPDDLRLLPAGAYYYLLDIPSPIDTTYFYPTCETFQDWVMPEQLPANWTLPRRTSAKAAEPYHSDADTSTVDDHCLLTGIPERLEDSHIVPEAAYAWSGMWMSDGGYGPGVVFNGLHNLITLRLDIHQGCFNLRQFALFPYDGQCLCFFWTIGGFDLIPNAHGRNFPLPTRIKPVYLYARFAWNLFQGPHYKLLRGSLLRRSRTPSDDGSSDFYGDHRACTSSDSDSDPNEGSILSLDRKELKHSRLRDEHFSHALQVSQLRSLGSILSCIFIYVPCPCPFYDSSQTLTFV
ncbi:hypothetical protein C8R46DRAFT_1129384 [Mycena filopes]|nr:hypothetical protein C8R46DRAFT_1129384 [Mycena filopes]